MILGEKVSFPGLGWEFNVDPVAFKLGSLDVYWYGICIAAGIMLCVALAIYQSKKLKFPDSLIYDIVLVAIPCAIVGARLYYVFCEWDYFSKDLKMIFNTREGGLAVYGGVIGAFLGVFIMCKIRKIPFTALADFAIVYIPLGQAIGRWGNYFNQEAFGTTTTLPWGMTSESVQTYLTYKCPTLVATCPVHPTFLYESICDLLIFFALMWVRKNSKYAFETTCVYFASYGFVRFFLEGLRTDSLYLFNTSIRTSQLLSLVLAVAALIYIAYARYNKIERKAVPDRFFEDKKPAESNG
ncbi:MAG: prolipoprotein diacylglyceryl transferase [Saccharofermentans sp.]|nr:prolipoprotein diacylglyceryl transferase [Saccharofermentans sp.]